MATNHGHGNEGGRNPSVGYDKSDLSARGILIFFFVLAVFAIAIHLGVLGLYVGMTKIAERHEPEVSPLAPQTFTPRDGILTNTANVNIQQFPEPRLLRHIAGPGGGLGEMSKFLLQETSELTAKPWQDDQGNVHLPIEQAMQTVVSRLPVRQGGTALPNYPGAAREYAYPTAPSGDGTAQSAAQNEMQSELQAGGSGPSNVNPGEAGNSPAGN
jgi:hypothetical protein